jgi:hypothetical protein
MRLTTYIPGKHLPHQSESGMINEWWRFQTFKLIGIRGMCGAVAPIQDNLFDVAYRAQ